MKSKKYRKRGGMFCCKPNKNNSPVNEKIPKVSVKNTTVAKKSVKNNKKTAISSKKFTKNSSSKNMIQEYNPILHSLNLNSNNSFSLDKENGTIIEYLEHPSSIPKRIPIKRENRSIINLPAKIPKNNWENIRKGNGLIFKMLQKKK